MRARRVEPLPLPWITEGLHGRSKMTGHIIREALIMVWRLLLQNKLRRKPRNKPPEDTTEKSDSEKPSPKGGEKT